MVVRDFHALQSRFKSTRERFNKAKTLEEKHELLAIAWQILREARKKLAQSRAQFLARKSRVN
jgi:hypothetical protein